MATTQKATAIEKKNMKMKSKLYLLAVITAALSLNIMTAVGQVFSSAEVLNNRAVAASPRAKELFPELARPAMSSSEITVATRTGINRLTEVRRNRALAASPRMREEFPELARGVEKTIEIAPLK